MSTVIQREFEFQSGVYHEGKCIFNIYDISLVICVDTDNIREQNIAMERISYFLSECIENSIFVQSTEQKVIDKYLAAGFNVCTLPAEPYDQIINVMLLIKLNAITEGKFEVTDISLSSKLSEGVTYLINNESAIGPFTQPGWWDDVNATISASVKQSTKEKIVHLFNDKIHDWSDIGLDWKEADSDKTEAVILKIPK